MKTVNQASEILSVNKSRILQFIYSKRLRAEKIGRDWLIKNSDLENFAKIERKTGRPTTRKEL